MLLINTSFLRGFRLQQLLRSRFPVPIPQMAVVPKAHIRGTRESLSLLCFNHPLWKFKNIPKKICGHPTPPPVSKFGARSLPTQNVWGWYHQWHQGILYPMIVGSYTASLYIYPKWLAVWPLASSINIISRWFKVVSYVLNISQVVQYPELLFIIVYSPMKISPLISSY